MQGLWKNDVSGWNHKDTKRKKQTRKHLMKDKAKAVYRIFDGKDTHKNDSRIHDDVYRVEKEQIIVIDQKKVYQKTSKVYNALITWSVPFWKYVIEEREFMDGSKREIPVKREFRTYYSIKRTVYLDPYATYNGSYIDYITNESVYNLLNLVQWKNNVDIKILSSTYDYAETSWKMRKEKDETPREFTQYNRKIFVYGKPINRKTFWRYWNDGKRRKSGQQLVNAKDRTLVRSFISKGDWDSDVRTHCYSKSISWYVH